MNYLSTIVVCCTLWCVPVGAEISTDGTLDGTTAQVLASTNGVYEIQQSHGNIVGNTNLFHSFSVFNLATNGGITETANFTGATSIENIFSRVTGCVGGSCNPTASLLDGILKSTIDGANLYFINPAGISFGPNAGLDIKGSFHATTADYLTFPGGGVFYANPINNTDILKTAAPSAFGFVGSPAKIDFTGQGGVASTTNTGLSVSEGKTISIIGGEIEFKQGSYNTDDGTRLGHLHAPGGRINLVSVIAAGEVVPGASGMEVSAAQSMGTITLKEESLVEVNSAGAGSIQIRGGVLVVDNSSIEAKTTGTQDGGLIDIDVGSFSLTGYARINSDITGDGNGADIKIVTTGPVNVDSSRIYFRSTGAGNAGDLSIEAESILFNDGGRIYGQALGSGKGGKATLKSNGSITFSGSPYGAIFMHGTGDAGTLLMDGNSILLDGGTNIVSHSYGSGNGGNITLLADESFIVKGQNSAGYGTYIGSVASSGKAGDIVVTANSILLDGGTNIVSNSYGSGNGGNITLLADESVIVKGQNSAGGTYIGLAAFSSGKAGDFVVTAKEVLLDDETHLSVDTLGSGAGGNITANVTDFSMDNGSYISARAYDSGKGGNITANVTDFSMDNGSIISATAYDSGKGGDVKFRASGKLSLKASLVDVTSNNIDNGGDGGSLSVQAKDILLEDGSYLLSSTFGSGNAGDVTVLSTGKVTVSGAGSNGWASSIGSGSNPKAQAGVVANIGGKAGNVYVEAGELVVTDGGHIGSSSIAPRDLVSRDGGDVIIRVAGAVKLSGVNLYGENEDGFAAGIYARTQGVDDNAGKAGTIDIEAGSITIENGAVITSSTNNNAMAGNVRAVARDFIHISGDAAKIALKAPGDSQLEFLQGFNATTYNQSVSGIYSKTESTSAKGGASGALSIDVPDLTVFDGGKISTSSAGGGKAGTITVATTNLQLYDLGELSVASNGVGGGGTINVTAADTLSIASNAKISASTSGSGSGGSITLNSAQLNITGTSPVEATTGLFATATASGSGGSIQATMQQMYLTNGGAISASSKGSGAAGTILVDASDSIKLTNGATISTDSASAGGGGITVNAVNRLHLINSAITTSVNGGGGNAGNIDIDPIFVFLEGSTIRANAFDGDGGSIHIQAQYFFSDPESVVEASSQLGIDGSIEIDSPGGDDNVVIEALPQTFVDSSNMLQSTCGAEARGNSSLSAKSVSFYSGGYEVAAKASPGGALKVGQQNGSVSPYASSALVANHGSTSAAARCTM